MGIVCGFVASLTVNRPQLGGMHLLIFSFLGWEIFGWRPVCHHASGFWIESVIGAAPCVSSRVDLRVSLGFIFLTFGWRPVGAESIVGVASLDPCAGAAFLAVPVLPGSRFEV